MAWVYLDDRFPEHPKVQEAGDKAAWLYITGLCYSNRNNTMGHIPRNALTKLTGFTDAPKLAKELIRVQLWEPADGFQIHDYGPWNRSAVKAANVRAEKARKAADARWGKHPPDDARAHAQALLEHVLEHSSEQCSSNGQAMLEHVPEHSPRTRAHALPKPQTHVYLPEVEFTVGDPQPVENRVKKLRCPGCQDLGYTQTPGGQREPCPVPDCEARRRQWCDKCSTSGWIEAEGGNGVIRCDCKPQPVEDR